MFRAIQHTLGHAMVIGCAVVMASTFNACQFDSSGPPAPITPQRINDLFASATPEGLYEGSRWTVYAEPNKIMVQHGYGCAETERGASEDHVGLRISDFLEVPSEYGDTATVFLNGWRLEYTGDNDHEVQGLGAAIFDIHQTPNTLQWQAGGVLSDKNGDDAFAWCYYYTIVIWRANSIDFVALPTHFDAFPRHSDQFADLTFVHPDGNDGESTALRELPGFFQDPLYTPKAVLPRGFGMMWHETDDHHLLQLAFDLGDSVTYIDSPDLGNPNPPGSIAWLSNTIFKDNSTLRGYVAAELVSILSGQSVEVLQPDFSIRPRSKSSCPNIGEPVFRQEQVTVNNVPFDHAIPMLTGWDIGDVCEDHHIKKIGAWIEDWDYVKQPGSSSGTLTYTIASVFTDDGGFFSSNGSAEPRYKVSILGFNEPSFPGGSVVQPTPDSGGNPAFPSFPGGSMVQPTPDGGGNPAVGGWSSLAPSFRFAR